LVYYNQRTHPGYWDELWKNDLRLEFFEQYRAGFLGDFEDIFRRHVPRSGPVVEAGCGLGQWVVALRSRGVDCIGLDYARSTIAAVRRLLPDVPFVSGDLTRLGLRTASCAGVISLGVVEHRPEGPEPFLAEMHRILSPGGRLLISVPYFNALRQWRGRRGAYQEDVAELEFYQYAYSAAEFKGYLTGAGFRVTAHYSYGHRKCLREELAAVRRLPSLPQRVVLRVADQVPYIRRELGHMQMCIAEKVA
jgi:SAM-dependent methyltransferase